MIKIKSFIRRRSIEIILLAVAFLVVGIMFYLDNLPAHLTEDTNTETVSTLEQFNDLTEDATENSAEDSIEDTLDLTNYSGKIVAKIQMPAGFTTDYVGDTYLAFRDSDLSNSFSISYCGEDSLDKYIPDDSYVKVSGDNYEAAFFTTEGDITLYNGFLQKGSVVYSINGSGVKLGTSEEFAKMISACILEVK